MDQLLIEVNEVDSTDKLIERQFVGLGGDLVLDSADLRPPTSSLLDRWSDSLKINQIKTRSKTNS